MALSEEFLLKVMQQKSVRKTPRKSRAELNFRRDKRIREMDAEQKLRLHRIELRETDEAFIECEKDLLAKDIERARMEEQVKHAAATVSGELEAHLTRERITAEHVVEIEREREILKALPTLVEKVSTNAPKIEQLRVMQFDGNNDKARPLPNSAAYSIAETLSLVREFLSSLKG